MNIMAVGKNKTSKYGIGWGSNIIFSMILRLLGRKSNGDEGTEISGKKIKNLKKNGMGKIIKL